MYVALHSGISKHLPPIWEAIKKAHSLVQEKSSQFVSLTEAYLSIFLAKVKVNLKDKEGRTQKKVQWDTGSVSDSSEDQSESGSFLSYQVKLFRVFVLFVF